MSIYCGNPNCTKKVMNKRFLYVKVGFEKPVCKDCFMSDNMKGENAMHSIKCEYQGTKIGIESEQGQIDCEKCTAEAKYVVRLITIPMSQMQAHLLFKRLCVCTEHGEYLCTDAPFKWENLPSVSPEEEVSKRGELISDEVTK
jgi:hypothetical protein